MEKTNLTLKKTEKTNLHCLVSIDTKEKVVEYAKKHNLENISQAVRILLDKGLESESK